MSTSMADQLGKLHKEIKVAPPKLSAEVIYSDQDDGREELPVVDNTDGLEPATQGDEFFSAVNGEGLIMNFKEKRKDRRSPNTASQPQPIGLTPVATITTPTGSTVEIPLSKEEAQAYIRNDVKAQQAARWSNLSMVGFTVAGTLVMALGIILGVNKEIRNRP